MKQPCVYIHTSNRNGALYVGVTSNLAQRAWRPHPSFRRKPESRESQMKQPCVYVLTSERNGALYVGVTSNLSQRAWRPHPSFRRKPESRESQMKQPCVYIHTSNRNGTLYLGVSSSGETCMKTWLEQDSGIHRNDGYASNSADGNLAPKPASPLKSLLPWLEKVRMRGNYTLALIQRSSGSRT